MLFLNELISQIPKLFLHPLLYFGVIIIILQYRRQISLERKLFSSRLHSLSFEVISSLGFGLLGGLLASSLMIVLGVVFNPTDMLLVWLITLILIMFHIRFLCLSYSTGILGVIAGLIQLYETPLRTFIDQIAVSWLAQGLDIFVDVHIPSLIAITAILHLVEAVLIKLQSSRQATPLFLQTKRGKLIGGFHIQSAWLLPLFLVVSVNDSSQGLSLFGSWWPLITGGTALSLVFLPIPAMIGYSDLTSVYTPKEKSNSAFMYLLIYSLVLLGLAIGAEYLPRMELVAALFAGLGHEAIYKISHRKEDKLPDKFVHPSDGLRVLAVIPGSLADRMGIVSGEIIKKVNGTPVATREELYYALQKQSAFTKLEIINLAGYLKFAQHSIYANDHHQLGIILAPDDQAKFFIETAETNLFSLIKQQVKKISRGA